MRDDEMISAGYPFICTTLHDNEAYVYYLSEQDKSQDIISKFMELVIGDRFDPSKDYGACIVHRGKSLGPDDEIFPISSNKFANNILLNFAKKNILKSIELPRKNSKKLQLLMLMMKMM